MRSIRSAGLALEDAPLLVPRRVLEHLPQLPIVGADLTQRDGRLADGGGSEDALDATVLRNGGGDRPRMT